MSDTDSIDSIKKLPRTTILSRVGSTLSGSQVAIELPFKPRTLEQRSSWIDVLIRVVVSIICVGLLPLIGLGAGWGATYIVPNDSVQSRLYECTRLKSSGMETYFQIDIRTPFELTFENARLMSIGWDIVAGQLGRLLHGWILYKFVISPGLNRLMETTSVPYLTYVDLKFQPTSLQVLWTLLRSFPHLGARAIFTVCWFLFAIIYTLGFASIWNASTGYTNPTKRFYQMPDESFLHMEQINALSFCWTHDDPRLSNVPSLIKSQTLDQLNATADMMKQDGAVNFTSPVVSFMTERTMIEYLMVPRNTTQYSNEFMDVYWYMMTQGQLLDYLNQTGWVSADYNAIVDGPLSTQNFTALNKTAGQTPWNIPNNTRWQHYPYATYSQIQAWQYTRQFPENIAPGSTQNTSWGPINYDGLLSSIYYSLTPNTAYATNFTFNSSTQATPGTVPYNSTFAWNGTSIALTAPFARFNADCNQVYGLGGPCLCYQDTPITYPLDDDHVICVSEDGYVWGFSSLVVTIGLGLEAIWILGCWVTWLDANVNSDLSKIRRNGAGPIRTAFDLVEAARHELGDDISTCTDDELRRALAKCGLVGYELQQEATGTRVKLVARERKKGRRKDDDELTVTSSFETLPSAREKSSV